MNNSKAAPVEWVSGHDPKACSVCSESFNPGDMIFRVGVIATHATERCLEKFHEDCDQFEEYSRRDTEKRQWKG